MPGPQMVAAMETSREIRRLRPHVRIVWGGYFPSLYPDTALNARYVDYVVRGQGEDTLLELIDALRGKRALESILGLVLQRRLRFSSHQPRAADERPGRVSVVALSSPSGRPIPAALILWQTDRGPSRQHRLPFQLQLLRCPCSLRKSRAYGVSRANGQDSQLSGGPDTAPTRFSSTT